MKLKSLNLSIGMILAINQVHADTFTVTNFDDSGPGSLRNAVQLANANLGPDTVVFQENLLPIGLTSGQINITESLSITGSKSGQIISANNNSRLFAATTPNESIDFSSLELINGKTTANTNDPSCSIIDGRGAAICSMGPLTLNKMRISLHITESNNSEGGAVFANNTLEINNSLVFDNKTEGTSKGGAVYSNGAINITNSGFISNSTDALRSYGGALSTSSNEVTINNSSFSHNSTNSEASGGAIHVIDATIKNSTFFSNDLNDLDSYGSAIFSEGNLTISSSTITGNEGSGAIYLEGNGVLNLRNSIVSSNTNGQNSDNIHAPDSPMINGYFSMIGAIPNATINGANFNNIFSDQPMLGGYSNNGCHIEAGRPLSSGCLFNHVPLINSPLINAGSIANPLKTDQRGACHPRISQGQTDIGAIESNIDDELVFCGEFD